MTGSELGGRIDYTLWCVSLLICFAFATQLQAQEQFLASLEKDVRVTPENLKVVSCRSAIHIQAVESEQQLSEGCTVQFKDGSEFAATLRYCKTFEQCEGAGGKFKDILVRVLRAKKKLQAKK